MKRERNISAVYGWYTVLCYVVFYFFFFHFFISMVRNYFAFVFLVCVLDMECCFWLCLYRVWRTSVTIWQFRKRFSSKAKVFFFFIWMMEYGKQVCISYVCDVRHETKWNWETIKKMKNNRKRMSCFLLPVFYLKLFPGCHYSSLHEILLEKMLN